MSQVWDNMSMRGVREAEGRGNDKTNKQTKNKTHSHPEQAVCYSVKQIDVDSNPIICFNTKLEIYR